jgi:hypothetical protein
MKLKWNRLGTTRWAFGVWAGVAALAHAASGDGPIPGYYRIDRSTQLQPEVNPTDVGVRIGNDSQAGRVDLEGRVGGVSTGRRSFDAPPEHQCVPAALTHKDWMATLRSICPAISPGERCETSGRNGSDIQVRRDGPNQWTLTYPLRIDSSNPQAGDQTRRALNDPRLAGSMSPKERAQIEAALRQLPTASAIRQQNEEAAEMAEAVAASSQGREAEIMREQARRLRAGTAGRMLGEVVERWTRISDRCPVRTQ